MVLTFLVVAIVFAFGADELKPRGPWVFVGYVQSPTKLVWADGNYSFRFLREIPEDNTTIETVFFVGHGEMKEGGSLRLALMPDPQPQAGLTKHHDAWVCFTREPTSYTEIPLDSGDVKWLPNGVPQPKSCEPARPTTSALGIVAPALAEASAERVAQAETSDFIYTPSDVSGLCRWKSKAPPVDGQSFVICEPSVLTTKDPGPRELGAFVAALQEERTAAVTKTSVLNRLSSLTPDQLQRLYQTPPPNRGSPASAAYCDDQQAYDDRDYSEPITLTLFDQSRSTDRVLAASAELVSEKMQAEALFADFLARGKPECRNQWVLRLDLPRAQRVVDMLGVLGVPVAEINAIDVQTPDPMRILLRPQATVNGDLYRMQASIPADASKLMCLAKLYRLVNIQDDAASVSPPGDVDKEFEILKARFAGKVRSVGWYSKIFQRDLLFGAHECGVSATVPS
jgi:hypothetical protein